MSQTAEVNLRVNCDYEETFLASDTLARYVLASDTSQIRFCCQIFVLFRLYSHRTAYKTHWQPIRENCADRNEFGRCPKPEHT